LLFDAFSAPLMVAKSSGSCRLGATMVQAYTVDSHPAIRRRSDARQVVADVARAALPRLQQGRPGPRVAGDPGETPHRALPGPLRLEPRLYPEVAFSPFAMVLRARGFAQRGAKGRGGDAAPFRAGHVGGERNDQIRER